ncbi:uncharacterized protein [Elaeis guineensis]|uniref:Uncharacterized protein LOC114912638 n=1 Tax=Elaeis guineensis var. tenera TaxID=51953 RepID=A0A8N4F3C6_ELAGV|nr:uncharacterized protein LOC114912638 [Elaeis guineensis]
MDAVSGLLPALDHLKELLLLGRLRPLPTDPSSLVARPPPLFLCRPPPAVFSIDAPTDRGCISRAKDGFTSFALVYRWIARGRFEICAADGFRTIQRSKVERRSITILRERYDPDASPMALRSGDAGSSNWVKKADAKIQMQRSST